MSAPSDDRIAQAYDPERFRAEGHALIDQLADYLTSATRGAAGLPVLPSGTPEENLARFGADFPEAPGTESLQALLARVVAGSTHLHHPRFVGHQVTAPLPHAALCDLVSSLLNNGMAVYEMGPVANAMERSVLTWMARELGLPEGAGGVLTSGGSAGNLTALLAARQARAGYDAWNGGPEAGPPLAVLVPESAHYCLARSVRILGWGEGGLVPVPVDARYRVRPDALPQALERARAAGRHVVAVVASAGSTATGAFDPLDAVADFAQRHGLWFHVDGAHGASAALSPSLRERVRGIERADSVVWDAHKLMLMPALCTAVLFREERRSFEAFAQEASYLFDAEQDPSRWSDSGLRTLECTKEMMALKLYACLRVFGAGLFRGYVEGAFALARRFAAQVREAEDFELAVEPDCNIVCFRLAPRGVAPERLDALNRRARERVLASGAFYLVQTQLPGRGLFLRVTLIHPLTREEDLAALLTAVRSAAESTA